MSTSTISSFIYLSQKVTIYLGIPILIAGIIGSLINIIVFRSIKIFRQNSCVFYLTIMSIVNIGQLLTGFLFRIMIGGFNIDWTQYSIFYCKFGWYCLYVCALMSITCMCFATIDRFLASCRSPHWRKWSNIRVAHLVTAISLSIWMIYGIPYLIYNDLIRLLPTGQLTCTTTNVSFSQFNIYSSILFFGGFLPIFINSLFGLLAYLNGQRLSGPALPSIRHELEKQLTMIVFVQIIYNFIACIPFLLVTILIVNIMIMNDPLMGAKLQFATTVTICLYYLYFSVSIK